LQRTEATGEIAESLALSPGEPVWRLEGLQSIGGAEINLGTSWYPALRFPDIDVRRQMTQSITEILKSYGVADYLRAWTRIIARRATEAEARMLHQPAGSPVFDIQKLDAEPDGRPLAYGSALWAADRVQFLVPGHLGTTSGSDCP
jgi:GntR family phosphonate transport system transcriptional regulator